jgi:RNA-binding protein
MKPVVIVGNAGLTEAVLVEIDASLEHHELLKVKVNAEDRERRASLAETISQRTRAELVQMIGQVAVFYRPAQHPRIMLP